MDFKKLSCCMYLKSGKVYTAMKEKELVNPTEMLDLCKTINDSGIDLVYCLDLSEDAGEHHTHLSMLKTFCDNCEVPVAAGGYINTVEDMKKVLYSGCRFVVINGSKPDSATLLKEGGERFGKDKIVLSLQNVDILFKHKDLADLYVSHLLVLKEKIIDAIENVCDIPMSPIFYELDVEKASKYLDRDQIYGVGGVHLESYSTNVMDFKYKLMEKRFQMNTFQPVITWDQLKKNSDGLIPAIAQDYQTNEVLMLAYMNEESFHKTLQLGKVTYWSRSRQELWTKGDTSGHYQYVKAVYTDCDYDTILVKVSQVGAACHTGKRSCFFNEIYKKDYVEKNPLMVFEDVYRTIEDRKLNPKEGSNTNLLMQKGLDEILKKVGEEATEVILAAKNPDKQEMKYEITDLLYHIMVLMVEKEVTWQDVIHELTHRE